MVKTLDGSFELTVCEDVILGEIADKAMKRRDVSQTYALAMKSSEANRVDWEKVNRAIINRWSKAGLEWIKKQAWSGKCFGKGGGEK